MLVRDGTTGPGDCQLAAGLRAGARLGEPEAELALS